MKSVYSLVIACLIVSMLFVFNKSFAQSKIKDGSVPGSKKNAPAGVLLELESNKQGFLLPRLTIQQRNAIEQSYLTTGLIIFNTTFKCIDYWNMEQGRWLSIFGQPVATIDTLQCSKVVINGVYKRGKALTSDNHLSVGVTVSQPGSYMISAATTNGYTFKGNGSFPAKGEYTVNLVGSGSPIAVTPDDGVGDEVSITVNGINSNCKPHIKIAPADVAYEMACNTSAVNGRYMIGVPFTAANTITLVVNVIEPGAYAIKSNTANGYYFAGSGTFTTTGEQKVTLKGTGTPAAAGINTFTLTSNSAVSNTCSGLTVSIPALAYTTNCNEKAVKGTYRRSIPLTADNRIILPVTVTATGSFKIMTDFQNGMSFVSSGVFNDTGLTYVVLRGIGTPVTNGNYTFTIYTNSSKASGTCQFTIYVQLRTIRVLGMGEYGFQPGSEADDQTARAVLLSTANFGPNGKVAIEGINITNGGVQLPDFTSISKYDIIVIGSGYYPGGTDRAILENFVKNKKGVVLNFNDGDNTASKDLAQELYYGYVETKYVSHYRNDETGAIYQLANFDDPVLNGPFGDIRGRYWGAHGSSDIYNFNYGLPDDIIVYSKGASKTGHGQWGRSVTCCFRHATLGYLWAGNGGFIAGKEKYQVNSYYWPAANDNGYPVPRYYGWGSDGADVFNSVFYANAMAWAVKYVLENNP